MPTCPGCKQRLSNSGLAVHERCCPELGNDERDVTEYLQTLERRVGTLEADLDAAERASVERTAKRTINRYNSQIPR